MAADTTLQRDYKLLPTKECVDYLSNHGLSLDSVDTSLSIPSQYGFLYRLPTEEIVLIPTATGMTYEGFIFKNQSAFERMLKDDFFPISESYQTYWELERNNLKRLPYSISYFENLLKKELNLEIFSRNPESLESVYHLLVKYIRKKDQNDRSKLKERVALSYSIMVMAYLVDSKGAEWKLDTRYEIYNSYNYPFVILDGEPLLVNGVLFSTLGTSKGNFRFFREELGL